MNFREVSFSACTPEFLVKCAEDKIERIDIYTGEGFDHSLFPLDFGDGVLRWSMRAPEPENDFVLDGKGIHKTQYFNYEQGSNS